MTVMALVELIRGIATDEEIRRNLAFLEGELAEFYASLLKSEARHFNVYLKLAEQLSEGADISDRVAFFLAKDEQLVTSPDDDFRFHSGVPG